MRRRSPAFSFNQEFEELKSNVKKAQDLAVAVAVSELCNESKIAKRVDLLCAEFSRMKEEVEKGNLQFGMVVGEIKAKFEYSLKGLEDKLKRKLKKHRKQNVKTTAALEEAYQKAFAFIDRLEKREELHDRVIQALSPYSVDEVRRITPIAVRAEHMTKETDWLKKYQTAKEVCDKFNLFADLYESPDLDVVIATKEDLENMRHFVRENSKVKVTMLPEKRQISVHVESAWKGQPVVNVGEWEQLRNLHQEFFGWHPGEWDRNWAEYGVYHLIGLGWDNRYDWDQVPGINAAVARVNAAYAQGYAINTVALTEALKVPFPSDSFNRLVDRFNRFVSLL